MSTPIPWLVSGLLAIQSTVPDDEPRFRVVAQVNHVYLDREAVSTEHPDGFRGFREDHCLEVTVRSAEKADALGFGDVLFVRWSRVVWERGDEVQPSRGGEAPFTPPTAGTRVELRLARFRGRVVLASATGWRAVEPDLGAPIDTAALDVVRDLLGASRRQHLSSAPRYYGDFSADRELRRLGAIEELCHLHRTRDATLLRLSGSHFGHLVRSLDAAHFAARFVEDLSPETPREWRRFAVEALRHCPTEAAVPGLAALLDHSEERIDATIALTRLGSADWLPAWFEDAASRPAPLDRYALAAFRELGGVDLGHDLQAWRRFFQLTGRLPWDGGW